MNMTGPTAKQEADVEFEYPVAYVPICELFHASTLEVHSITVTLT